MSIFVNIDERVNNYLCGDISNPLLKKVIEEEITFSNNLGIIFKKYFDDVVESANFNDKLNNLSNLIKNVSNDTKNILRTFICNTFIELSSDQHIFLITSINDNIKNIFELFADDPSIIDILKYIVSGLTISINKEEYVIKCIDACSLINKNIAFAIITEYINNNGIDLITNDTLLIYFLKFINNNKNDFPHDIFNNFMNLIIMKISSIKDNLDTFSLTDMNFAFEIYKLGKIVIESNLEYNRTYWNLRILKLKDEQLEYIVKAIHTCILKNNIAQAQTILAIIYLMDNDNMIKLIEYYNKSLLLRVYNSDILSIEYNVWNINNQYDKIINNSMFSSYNQNIYNIKYSNIINNDLIKIKVLNSNINMNNVNIKIVSKNENNHFDDIVHHKQIQQYINNMNKYFALKSSLQNINYDMEKSKITIKTSMGSIRCSLIFGSILLHLNDKDMSIAELSTELKINDDEIIKRINSLIKYNVVIKNNLVYKYTAPYGNVECDILSDVIEPIQIERFTDIIMTIESRIVKEVKSNKMNIMELERRIQEFLGESFVKNIFYDRLESLKKRYYVKDTDSIIEYVV